MTALHAVPVDLREANAFVSAFHRHNGPTRGWRFGVGCSDGARLVGVAIVGRPVARALQNGVTAEVLRCCVTEAAPKGANSFLYACCWRAWKAMGGQRLITYTLQAESGASLRGAGWRVVAELAADNPAKWQNRGRGRQWHAATGQAKFRWEAAIV